MTKQQWITPWGYTRKTNDDVNVFDAAVQRMRELYALGIPVWISFSAGKDSTCVLHLALQVAREFDRLPLDVIMLDEEVIDPDSIAYATQMVNHPDIRFHWLCIPIRHTLRSNLRTHWYTWDPNERDKWARSQPEWAVTSLPAYEDSSLYLTTGGYSDVIRYYHRSLGIDKIVSVTGVRAEEAFNRLRAIVNSGSYVSNQSSCYYAKPIYDWKWTDVWRSIYNYGWPYSDFYRKMFQVGEAPAYTRVAPWGNVASSQTGYYPEFYPDFWQRAIIRLPELKAGARYIRTALFKKGNSKPPGLTWQEYAYVVLADLDEESRRYWLNHIDSSVNKWSRAFTIPFPDVETVIDGRKELVCWKRLCRSIIKNDRFGGSSRDSM